MPVFELYVRVKDKVAPDHPMYAGSFKSGDVMAIVPEGHQWGPAELASREHVIIKVEADDYNRLCSDLMTGEVNDPNNGIEGMKRVGGINFSQLPASYQIYDTQRPILMFSEAAIEMNSNVMRDIASLQAARGYSREVAREIVVNQIKTSLIKNLDPKFVEEEDAKVPRPILSRSDVLAAFAIRVGKARGAQ